MPALTNTALDIVGASRVETEQAEWAMARTPAGLRLAVLAKPEARHVLDEFEGEVTPHEGRWLLGAPLTAKNAAALRRHLPWLAARPLGLQTSAGMGDRLGLATPGHVRAMQASGRGLAPIYAQQSIREMTRTGRTPQQVMDDATWGAFAAGWRGMVGADADHLKTTADIDSCLAAGFSFFTIDPSEHVDSAADTDTVDALRAKFDALPWDVLGDTPDGARARYAGRTFAIEEHRITVDETAVLRAAVKYGRAVCHVLRMYTHLAAVSMGRPFDLEVSVDETETPTTPAEHLYVATEMRRLGIQWVSLAPRFVGRFEKGVDYIGDVAVFEREFALHAAIARFAGPYKLSLHSGSDKFSIYGIAARLARGLVHLKTAGTSYLEALRALSVAEPALFREIYVFSRERYEVDKQTYHVSADLGRAPAPETLTDAQLPALLEDFDARQVLHVTFGSVLKTPGLSERFRAALIAHQAAYDACLEAHFKRHLEPFAAVQG
jgi:hypothetical protein